MIDPDSHFLPMIDHRKQFGRGDDRSSDRHLFPLIDHRKQFGGEMIGTFCRGLIIGNSLTGR